MNIILSSLIISFFVANDSCFGEPCLPGKGTYGGDFGQYDMAACEKCATQKTSGQCCLSIYHNSYGRSEDFEDSPNDGGCVKIGKPCTPSDGGCAPGLQCGIVNFKGFEEGEFYCGYQNVDADADKGENDDTFITFPGDMLVLSTSTIQIHNGKSSNNINNNRLFPAWGAAVAVLCFLVVVAMATYWKVARARVRCCRCRHVSQDQYIEVEHDFLL